MLMHFYLKSVICTKECMINELGLFGNTTLVKDDIRFITEKQRSKEKYHFKL
jgi:hypothetical protein